MVIILPRSHSAHLLLQTAYHFFEFILIINNRTALCCTATSRFICREVINMIYLQEVTQIPVSKIETIPKKIANSRIYRDT
jgi:hypothetical protein